MQAWWLCGHSVDDTGDFHDEATQDDVCSACPRSFAHLASLTPLPVPILRYGFHKESNGSVLHPLHLSIVYRLILYVYPVPGLPCLAVGEEVVVCEASPFGKGTKEFQMQVGVREPPQLLAGPVGQ